MAKPEEENKKACLPQKQPPGNLPHDCATDDIGEVGDKKDGEPCRDDEEPSILRVLKRDVSIHSNVTVSPLTEVSSRPFCSFLVNSTLRAVGF